MPIPLPDFEAWAVFAKVAEHGAFARAADELGLAKATVSKALGRLEARLGAPLIHRNSRRLSLTEAGRAALPRARRLLAEGEALEDAAADRASEPRGPVRLAAPVSFGTAALGAMIPQFLLRHPHVELDVRLSDHRADMVASGIDLAIRIGDLPDSGLRARRLHAIRMVAVAAPAYLDRRGAPAHPRDLAAHDVLVFSHVAAPRLRRFVHPEHGGCEVRVAGRLAVDNGDVALPALAAGLCLGVLPEFLVWRGMRDGTIVPVLPGWDAGSAPLHLVTQAGPRPARVAALLSFLADRLPLACRTAEGDRT